MKLLQKPANRHFKSFTALGKKIGCTRQRAQELLRLMSDELEVQRLDGFNIILRDPDVHSETVADGRG